MKVITIDSKAYKSLVRKIDRIYEYVKNQAAPSNKSALNPDEIWIDNDEATAMLKVSGRTFTSYFTDKKVIQISCFGCLFYPQESINFCNNFFGFA